MTIRISFQEAAGCIGMEGRFDFLVHREFKQAYVDMLNNAAIGEIQVSLEHLDFMDSTALGMLLLLRERAHAANKSVVLTNPSKIAAKLLWVANFDKLFEIRGGEAFRATDEADSTGR